MGIELNNDQIFATMAGEKWWKNGTSQIFQVAGGAGTGKTTMILALIEKIGLRLDQVLFVSYMGKAVSQMIRNGLPAKTIHATCYTYEKEVARDEEGHMIILDNGKPKMVFNQKLRDKIPGNPKLIVVDEGYTVPEQNAKDLLTFGIPVIALGDSNQLPPPFGRPFFLQTHDVMLHQIMRQAEGNPIIWLAQQAIEGKEIREGNYGSCRVMRKQQMTDYVLRHADVVITSTNRLRGAINDLFRESFLGFSQLEYPHYGEKIICRRNNWGRKITLHGGDVYLTNGTTGFVDYVEKKTYSQKSMTIDFLTDFSNKPFRNVKIDMAHLNAPLVGQKDASWTPPDMDVFEYAYALTIYSCQGSQYPKTCVLMEENYRMSEDTYCKSLYSAFTRASESMDIVLPY